MYARLRRPAHIDYTGDANVILMWAERYGVEAVEVSFDWPCQRKWYTLRRCDIPHLRMLALR